MLVLPWTALTQTIDSMDWDDDSISDPLPPRTFTTDTSDRIPSELINLEVALDENGEDSVEVAESVLTWETCTSQQEKRKAVLQASGILNEPHKYMKIP